MKTFSILSCVALLSGCAAQYAKMDVAQCDNYGFQRGTPDFARCRMDLDRQRADEKREFHKKMRDEYIP